MAKKSSESCIEIDITNVLALLRNNEATVRVDGKKASLVLDTEMDNDAQEALWCKISEEASDRAYDCAEIDDDELDDEEDDIDDIEEPDSDMEGE